MRLLLAIFFGTALFNGQVAEQHPIAWTLTGAPMKPGASATARLKATIQPGWHLYGLKQPEDGPKPTRISVPEGQRYQLKNSVKALKPIREFDQNFGLEVEFYERETTFQIPVKLDGIPDAPLKVNVYYQSCNANHCLPPRTMTVEATR